MSVLHATILEQGALYPGCDRNRTHGAVESTGRRAARPRDGRGLSCGGWRPRPLLRFLLPRADVRDARAVPGHAEPAVPAARTFSRKSVAGLAARLVGALLRLLGLAGA